VQRSWPEPVSPLHCSPCNEPGCSPVRGTVPPHEHRHEKLPRRYGILEDFNHKYVVKHAPPGFRTTLEIGDGLGEHLAYEKLTGEQERNYVAVELRENTAARIRERFPRVQTHVGDCQGKLAFPDGAFDRVLAVHVLEHSPNLPAAVREMHRLCHPERGVISVVLPCEGGWACTLARRISAQRIVEKGCKPAEILRELEPYFEIVHRSFFPLRIPVVWCNLCIGLTLRPKKLK